MSRWRRPVAPRTGIAQGAVNPVTLLGTSRGEQTNDTVVPSLLSDDVIADITALADDIATNIIASSTPIDDNLVLALAGLSVQAAITSGDEDAMFGELTGALLLASTDGTTSAIDQVYGDVCSDSANLPSYCSEYFDRCIFGSWDRVQLECYCQSGYYGTTCNALCPGGPANVCNKHGTCDAVTGTCHCQVNWNGTSTCSSCTLGWVGADCMVNVLSGGSTTDGKCIALSNGR